MAILETEALTLSPSILPICLPEFETDSFKDYVEREVQLIGWGANDLNGEISETLKTADVTVFSQR